MRPAVRIVMLGCALLLCGAGLVAGTGAGAVSPAVVSPIEPVFAQVAATNWALAPQTTTPNASGEATPGVSCATSSFCMAVQAQGSTTTPLAQEWNGSSWSVVNAPGPSGSFLTGVSCVSSTFCIAVGGTSTPTPLVDQWNGSQWSTVPVTVPAGTNAFLNGVSCLSAVFCMAAGATGTGAPYIEQWNGTSWTQTVLPIPSGSSHMELLSLSCSEPALCIAVGEQQVSGNFVSLGELWNGSSWATSNTVNAPGHSLTVLTSVSCAGGSFCAASGYADDGNFDNTGITVIEVWTGSTWVIEPTPNTSGSFGNFLYGISCISATSCTAVGSAYTDASTSTYQSIGIIFQGGWHLVTVPNSPVAPNLSITYGVSCLTQWACVSVGQGTAGGGGFAPFAAWALIARSGYRFVASDGGVFTYGAGAPFLGSMGGTPLNAPVVGMAVMPAGDGYYLVASDGGIFSFVSAQFHGSTGNIRLNKPIVGMAVTADGGGYWLVASDGGVFAFGDAQFLGSMGGTPLNKPIVGMAPTPNGLGYYLVASDGGIFSFGNAVFQGSTGSLVLNKPVVGMAVTTSGGYYLVATDGGIFAFANGLASAPFLGSTGNLILNKPVVGMTAEVLGYYLSGSDGGIFTFPPGGVPPFLGSTGNIVLNKPIVGISG
jgi:hypothetical protein